MMYFRGIFAENPENQPLGRSQVAPPFAQFPSWKRLPFA
jgi:hypothetical protein